VFCEKPLSFSENEIQKIIKMMRDHKFFIQVGLNRRFDQDFVIAKKKVDAGLIGDIHTIHITNHDAAIPGFKFLKSSGGMLLDLCIHDFDMLNFLTGEKIKEVYVNGAVFIEPRLKDIDDIDNAIITLELESGILCSIDSSRQTHYGYDQRIEIFGSKGIISVENKPENLYYFSNQESTETSKIKHSFIERYKDSYIEELKHFYTCIMSNTKPNPGPENILSAIRVAAAGRKSLETKSPQGVKDE
ncbi:MAG: Gfo/Idh/MocA family oxidoreductase, partial [Candidatus Neomarinimicrobiota bacterium]|nr:Gfo/Idh/MocA family oxidoreductase [Candidatus Neomarinimicrobiota bacterium]